MKLASENFPYLLPEHHRSVLVAYLLWLFWGFFGAHKLYLGKPLVALLYFFTWGLLGVGWLIDLFTIPGQVAWCNLFSYFNRLSEGGAPVRGSAPAREVPRRPRNAEHLMLALLEHARTHGGTVSVTEGVMATGFPFKKVERVLQKMLSSGYVDVENDPETGVVRYVFHELAESSGGT